MDRNITNEVSKWVKGSHFGRFQEAFWAFENENFEAGRIPKQKDIERFQKKAKVPLVGEIYRSIEDSNTTQRPESTGRVIQFSPWRQFKVSEHLKELFFDFPYIKFVPGIVHYQSERIYPDDDEALRFLKGSLRILKGLCLSAIGEGRIEEQRFLSSDLAGTFICTGGPVSNAISRIAMQYGRKERDPTKGLLRITEPLINLRYEPVYDVEEVISEAGCIVRFIDNQIHRAPNWFIRDTRSGELLKPAKHKKNDVLTTDFLLISILPNILDRESYERGDKIQIFGGTHGVGTRAVELVCSDNSLIDQINGLAGKLPYWQTLLEIDQIDHSKGQSRPISLRSDIRWGEVTLNEAELDEWFGSDLLPSNHFHRSNVIKNGRVQRTASREKSIGEDSSNVPGSVQSLLGGRVDEQLQGRKEVVKSKKDDAHSSFKVNHIKASSNLLDIETFVKRVGPVYARKSGKSEDDAYDAVKWYISSILENMKVGEKKKLPLLGPEKENIIIKKSHSEFYLFPIRKRKRGD